MASPPFPSRLARRAAVAALAPAAFPAEEARRAAEEVLARPEYQFPGPGVFDRLINAISEQLGRLLSGSGGGVASSVSVVLVVVVLLVLVAVIARFVARLRRGRVLDFAVPGAIGRGPTEWAAEAAAHETAGRWRDALRCRYRELLAALAAAGLVDEVPGRTTGEYLDAVGRAAPAAAAPFADVTAAFEAVWYGGAACDADTVAALVAAAGLVRARTGRPRGGLSPEEATDDPDLAQGDHSVAVPS